MIAADAGWYALILNPKEWGGAWRASVIAWMDPHDYNGDALVIGEHGYLADWQGPCWLTNVLKEGGDLVGYFHPNHRPEPGDAESEALAERAKFDKEQLLEREATQ
jgi:hypothetical protein